MKLDIVKRTFNYVIVNKPAGITCAVDGRNNIVDELTNEFQKFLPDVSPSQFRILQRLDRFVTGGLIIPRNKKWADKVRKAFASAGNLKITTRYVGLIPLARAPKKTSGTIDREIEALEKDIGRRSHDDKPRRVFKYEAKTHYQLLPNLARELQGKYPVFRCGQVVPAIFQLESGRKNQIRDPVLQKFGVTLLNDDNFADFKFLSVTPKKVNSTLFKSNQIGLHAGLLIVEHNGVSEDFLMPVHNVYDRELWGSFLDDNGELISPIRKALLGFRC
ncbi:hypothetical protein Cantr_06005 [Candida viswanathii]|uniref:21S rRNA pseudouridine(2819) synthase n=1 Tax=Candida viswanathii TaxID=5486 RepID=A0A367XSH6_9ASCO|nr:hypothetical protein Cantr_06005 [Candida viswanathii]